MALLDEQVVRKNTTEIVLGTKTFERGVSVKHMRISSELILADLGCLHGIQSEGNA